MFQGRGYRPSARSGGCAAKYNRYMSRQHAAFMAVSMRPQLKYGREHAASLKGGALEWCVAEL